MGGGRVGLEQPWAKGGILLRTLGDNVGARARGGWQTHNISEVGKRAQRGKAPHDARSTWQWGSPRLKVS